MRAATGIPSGSNDYGSLRLQSLQQNNSRIVLGNFPRTPRTPGAEIIRARIRRSGITSYEVDAPRNCAGHALLTESGAEIACRCDGLQLFNGHCLLPENLRTDRNIHSTLWLTSMKNHTSPPMAVTSAAKSSA